MHVFTFDGPNDHMANVLAHRSTEATVQFVSTSANGQKQEIFIPATLKNDEPAGPWEAHVGGVPQVKDGGLGEATLYLTKGELGKNLGSLALGSVWMGRDGRVPEDS